MVQAARRDARPLRVGVVGVGVMGSNHARVFADLPGVTLVGVADPDGKQRDFVSRALGCPEFSGVEPLLAAGVDAVTIAAPTHLHRELAFCCIERGVHVLVEKPIAPSVEEGRAIIAAARQAGVVLMVGHVERFNPTVEAIKDAICEEDILSIAITRVGPFPPRMSNVGVVIDLAVHDIDLIRWFTDSEIAEVQPQLSNAIAERARSTRAQGLFFPIPDAAVLVTVMVGVTIIPISISGWGMRELAVISLLSRYGWRRKRPYCFPSASACASHWVRCQEH